MQKMNKLMHNELILPQPKFNFERLDAAKHLCIELGFAL
jgi:hypothetical protein